MGLTKVFEPLRIGDVEIKNRIISPAHGTRGSRRRPRSWAGGGHRLTQNEPSRSLYDQLVAEGHPDVVLVGDAASPRDLTQAVREGHVAARAIAVPHHAAA